MRYANDYPICFDGGLMMNKQQTLNNILWIWAEILCGNSIFEWTGSSGFKLKSQHVL